MALSKIQGNEDTECKFAKTELILTYFNAHDEGLKSSYFPKIEFCVKIRQKSLTKWNNTHDQIHFQLRSILSQVQKYFRKRVQMNPIEDLKSMKNIWKP